MGMKSWKILVMVILAVLLVAGTGFAIWGSTPQGPMPEAYLAMQNDAQIAVFAGDWISFQPLGVNPDTSFILYPGAHVDFLSYAPAAREIASQGYLAIIARMPFNLAVLAPDQAAQIIAAYPSVKHWAIGGHSLGGSMAARFAYSHPGAVQGLVLWASYPAKNDDLSKSGLVVASIYGTKDGLATPQEIDASRALLPADTQYVAIQGGNHAQFGWYGAQGSDHPATIDRQTQQDQAVAATVAVLRRIRSK